MTPRSMPCGRCTSCGKAVWTPESDRQRCANIIDSQRCTGTIRSAVMEGDWLECQDCGNTGRVEGHQCVSCSGDGWIFTR